MEFLFGIVMVFSVRESNIVPKKGLHGRVWVGLGSYPVCCSTLLVGNFLEPEEGSIFWIRPGVWYMHICRFGYIYEFIKARDLLKKPEEEDQSEKHKVML